MKFRFGGSNRRILGWTFLILLFASCEKNNLPPVAKFKISAYLADTLTVLEFDATAVSDPEDQQLALFVRWDFQGDGEWDTDFSNQKILAYRYYKQGHYRPVVEVKDQDGATDTTSLELLITEVMKVSRMVDSRDGRTYKITLIEDVWWMSENLDYGKWIMASQGQENNGIVEKYYYINDSTQSLFKGGLYTWKEVSDWSKKNLPRGICPEGWQLPDGVTLAKLFNKNNLVSPQYRLFGPGGFWNLDLPESGATYGWYQKYEFSLGDSHWWTGEYYGDYTNNRPYVIWYRGNLNLIYTNGDGEASNYYQSALPVRCIKKVQ
jgi:uncharacterized protein (TIGR02145 family)